MITMAILLVLVVGCTILTFRFLDKYKKSKYATMEESISAVLGVISGLIAMGAGVTLICQLGMGVGNYCNSLELEKMRAQALTSRQAVLKTRNYSNKSFSAHGNVLGGDLKVRYGVPLIRHKLEERAVKNIEQYNKELARMKGAKRGWLWTPGWGYSSVIDTMKPIDVPLKR